MKINKSLQVITTFIFITGFLNQLVGQVNDVSRSPSTGTVTTDSQLIVKGQIAPKSFSYTQKVQIMLDNLIEHGRDRYGRENSPLFAAILDQNSLDCPRNAPEYLVDTVRLDPGRYKNRRNPRGGDIYHDQALFKTMAIMSHLTGDPKYHQAAIDALTFAMNKAVDSKGFPAMGGHMSWDFYQDCLEADGEFHELWNWPLVWDLWWEADPKAMKRYSKLMWDWHLVDKTTGETNRHSDKKQGYAFTFSSGSMMSQWAYVSTKDQSEPYHNWCDTVAGFHWQGRNRDTGLFDSSGKYTDGNFTTMQATVARDWIIAGNQTKNNELIQHGRTILDNYAKYGYDNKTQRFYASLKLNGTPLEPNAERGLVAGDARRPKGYLAIWQPHVGWQEEPLAMAQTYAWAAENIDRQIYLPTAKHFGRLIKKAWEQRYGRNENWQSLHDQLRPLEIEFVKIKGVLHPKHIDSEKVDKQAMKIYRKGGYVYQAPFGLFADHYGRTIQFALSMQRLTGEQEWINLAKEVAKEAENTLWRGKLFVGHSTKQHYMNTDHIGLLCYSLLQLEAVLANKEFTGQMLF